MKNCVHLALGAAASLMTSAITYAAGLEGAQVTVTGYCCSGPIEADRFTVPATASVGPGVEFPAGSIVTTTRELIESNIDVSAFAIDLQYTDSSTAAVAAFNGYSFDFSELGANRITGVALDALSTFAPGSVGLTFDADSVFYNGSGLTFTPASRVLIDVTLAPIPEPTTVVLLLAGLAVLAAKVNGIRRTET
jgi:hypothetical protein